MSLVYINKLIGLFISAYIGTPCLIQLEKFFFKKRLFLPNPKLSSERADEILKANTTDFRERGGKRWWHEK